MTDPRGIHQPYLASVVGEHRGDLVTRSAEPSLDDHRRRGLAHGSPRGSTLTRVWNASTEGGDDPIETSRVEWCDLRALLGSDGGRPVPPPRAEGLARPAEARRTIGSRRGRRGILSTGGWSIPLLVVLLLGLATRSVADPGPVERARELAKSGQRGEAVRILKEHLDRSPDDVDGRTYLGAILSWDGFYDEAREHLQEVLRRRPGYGDAVRALLNVELWSGHPARAEELASDALRASPNSADLHLARAKALSAMGRMRESEAEIEHALVLDMNNEAALAMRTALRRRPLPWLAGVTYSHDWFSDHRSAWDDVQASLRRTTRYGSIIGRYSVANHFDTTDDQLEIEAYPHIRSGTYAYVNYGHSLDGDVVFPEHRIGLELYQSLGHGFEASIGYRRLYFPRSEDGELAGRSQSGNPIVCSSNVDECRAGRVNIYTASLGKYYGNWLFLGRIYALPTADSRSRSYHGSVRRFLSGDGEQYWDVRYAHGRFREELRTLDEFELQSFDTIAVTLVLDVGKRWQISVRGSVSQEERLDNDDLRQSSVSVGLFRKF